MVEDLAHVGQETNCDVGTGQYVDDIQRENDGEKE